MPRPSYSHELLTRFRSIHIRAHNYTVNDRYIKHQNQLIIQNKRHNIIQIDVIGNARQRATMTIRKVVLTQNIQEMQEIR